VEKARRDAASISVVFLGDSITQGWNKEIWRKHFEPVGAVNFGIGGDGVQQVQWRVEHGELDALKPKLIVLMIGINNFWGKKGTNEEIVQGTTKLVRTLREKQPQSKILLLGILPAIENPTDGARTRIKTINSGYARLADGKNVRFLDIGPALLEPDGRISKEVMGDYLHPTALGYQRFVKALLPTFEEMRK
jgi:lysophospholipase L1-like esterase